MKRQEETLRGEKHGTGYGSQGVPGNRMLEITSANYSSENNGYHPYLCRFLLNI